VLVALCSGKGSPGVSTLACVVGAVWPAFREVVVAECDPSGNDLAVRFGLAPRRGTASLVLARRSAEGGGPMMDLHLQSLPGGLNVLTGPVNPDAARAVDRELATFGHDVFPLDVDVLVDCGRLSADANGQQSMIDAANRVIVVCRPDPAGIAHAKVALEAVNRSSSTTPPFLVAVGQSRFPTREIERALEVEIIEHVPTDPEAAGIACGMPGSPRRLARSRLVEAARRIANRLLDDAPVHEPDGAPADSLHSVERIGRALALSTDHLPGSNGQSARGG